MVTLTLLDPQQQTPLKQWQFENEPAIRIGRSPDNHVVVSDLLVSRQHLELSLGAGGTWHLVNYGTNGTFVDGTLVSRGPISDGALIQLAASGPLLKFHIGSPVAAGASWGNLRPIGAQILIGESQKAGAQWGQDISGPLLSCTHAGNSPANLFCIHCGQPLKVEGTIRQYLVLRTLGKGGMGTTYLACQPAGYGETPQLLVLKEMNADMAKIAKARELFEREARTLQSLCHPGIPRFFDFFVEGNKKYLAMELIHGQDLEKLVFQTGPLVPAQAIEWMIQTCDVLDYLHSQDPPIAHRDIKPANLMVRHPDGRVVVLDFGAVKEIGTPQGTRIGAPDYSAPEQSRGQPLIQSDLYALGPTLIFLLTGRSPHSFFQRRGQHYRFNLETIPTIAPDLRAVIDRVTEPKPGDRYQTANELVRALADCL
ncbi:FHA domain-containing serine/threonine-protein kinase [Kamptonema formosum]|uniref:FHA domain-containing serine/threonine-protein kinase n=1 Tax=Kamptonema formosum TaxID=331992 RepID=UPI00034A57E7|nr:FHA domain-containing serine/threonine-protein kinase [Oscillatoria sp. PCC 10802]